MGYGGDVGGGISVLLVSVVFLLLDPLDLRGERSCE